jgi:hypothetical protein
MKRTCNTKASRCTVCYTTIIVHTVYASDTGSRASRVIQRSPLHQTGNCKHIHVSRCSSTIAASIVAHVRSVAAVTRLSTSCLFAQQSLSFGQSLSRSVLVHDVHTECAHETMYVKLPDHCSSAYYNSVLTSHLSGFVCCVSALQQPLVINGSITAQLIDCVRNCSWSVHATVVCLYGMATVQ